MQSANTFTYTLILLCRSILIGMDVSFTCLFKWKSPQTLYHPPTDAPQSFPQSIIIIHSHQETEPHHLHHKPPLHRPSIIPILIVSRLLFNLLTGSKYVLYLILNTYDVSKNTIYNYCGVTVAQRLIHGWWMWRLCQTIMMQSVWQGKGHHCLDIFMWTQAALTC